MAEVVVWGVVAKCQNWKCSQCGSQLRVPPLEDEPVYGRMCLMCVVAVTSENALKEEQGLPDALLF